MQHAAVAQNLAEEVAKVADQLKDFELRAISAAGRGLTARADAALESRREWPPARVQPELILQFLTSPDVASWCKYAFSPLYVPDALSTVKSRS